MPEIYGNKKIHKLSEFLEVVDNFRFARGIFRGQSDSSKSLIPSIFREIYKEDKDISKNDILKCLHNEQQQIALFVEKANKLGFKLPGNLSKFINYRKKGFNRDDMDEWVRLENNDYIEIACLARHHGINARFLDFSYNIYKALYFPAIEVLKSISNNESQYDDICNKYLSLWFLDYRFLTLSHCDIMHFDVHTYYNEYIRAQNATFVGFDFKKLYEDEFNLEKNIIDIKSVYEDIAKDWYKRMPQTNNDADKPLIFKIDISYGLAPTIVNRLSANEKVNKFSLKPNLDYIIESSDDEKISIKYTQQFNKYIL